MTPNPRQLDIFLAEKLFGLTVSTGTFDDGSSEFCYVAEDKLVYLVPRFSTDAAAMLTVIEKMRERGFVFLIEPVHPKGYRVAFWKEAIHEHLPTAVAQAAHATLAALESHP